VRLTQNSARSKTVRSPKVKGKLMSRIGKQLVADSWVARFKSRENSLSDKALEVPLQTRLFLPEHFEHRYSYPLVVWLHSHASSEYELDDVMASISLRNYVGLGIRGTRTSKNHDRKFVWGSSLRALQQAEQKVLESIQLLVSQMPVNAQRIFIAGHGAGGTLAQSIGLRNPDRFAGVVSIHGSFPRRFQAPVNWDSARSLPVCFMYGQESKLCNEVDVRRSKQHGCGAGLGYQFVQFPHGDDLYSDMTQTANRFMMQIVTEFFEPSVEIDYDHDDVFSNSVDDFS
jgi:phospholipase/carboxylesterase